MKVKWLAITTVVVFVYLVIVNAFIFPIIFPEGLAEKFINSRAEHLALFHLMAFATTAALLTILVAKLGHDSPSMSRGLTAGIWLGLLVALPEHLHLYAMVDATAVQQSIPVFWTAATWGLAGLIVGFIGAKANTRNRIAE